jgi:hypothetical protein
MSQEVAVTELIEVACRQEDALAIIWAIQTIEQTEVKVDAVEVLPQTERTGTYKARGHFAGVPWRNEFAYVLHGQGFHSVEAHPPASGPRVKGGFTVVATGAHSCLILHYEQYVLSGWAVLLKYLIAGYLHWSMSKELRDLRNLILRRSAAPARA